MNGKLIHICNFFYIFGRDESKRSLICCTVFLDLLAFTNVLKDLCRQGEVVAFHFPYSHHVNVCRFITVIIIIITIIVIIIIISTIVIIIIIIIVVIDTILHFLLYHFGVVTFSFGFAILREKKCNNLYKNDQMKWGSALLE